MEENLSLVEIECEEEKNTNEDDVVTNKSALKEYEDTLGY